MKELALLGAISIHVVVFVSILVDPRGECVADPDTGMLLFWVSPGVMVGGVLLRPRKGLRVRVGGDSVPLSPHFSFSLFSPRMTSSSAKEIFVPPLRLALAGLVLLR